MESLSILHPLSSLEWSDCPIPALPIAVDDRVQAVLVPGDGDAKLYLSNELNALRFCSVASNPLKWHHHDLPLKISSYSLTEFCSNLVLVGGYTENSVTDKVWTLNSKTDDWEVLPAPMPTKRFSAVAVGHGSYLVVAGGRKSAEDLTVVEVYDDHSKQWKTVLVLPADGCLDQHRKYSFCRLSLK